MNKPLSDKPVVKIVTDLCHQYGIEQVVISPGSRNAPLILSFAGSEWFDCLTIVDERSAAYFALGLAKEKDKPVAIVCTSGTAALNFAPAIAEAYYQQIPLIVFTADRPAEWINQADGQAIQQEGIFRNFIRYQCQLPIAVGHPDDDWYTNRLVNDALAAATGLVKGPVHINIPLREPLYGKTVYPAKPTRRITNMGPSGELNPESIQTLTHEMNNFDRVMVLMGASTPSIALNLTLTKLAEKGVVVLTENLSNVDHPRFIHNMDRVVATIDEEDFALYAPDLLITLDIPVLSRMIKKLLRTRKPQMHWHFSNQASATDTYQCLSRKIEGDAVSTLSKLADSAEVKQMRFSESWNKRNQYAMGRHQLYLNRIKWSDLKLFEVLSTTDIPYGPIHLGNSTPVRYAQLFDWKNKHTWFANRGTSGIDGCVSTAVGAAHGSKQPALLIIGDLSFFYDSNGLWNHYLRPDFRILLINNSGGGIFRYLPGSSESEELEPFFEAKQSYNASGIAQTFGLDYHSCGNEQELREKLGAFMQPSNKPALLEVFTPNVDNGRFLKDYFRFLKNNDI